LKELIYLPAMVGPTYDDERVFRVAAALDWFVRGSVIRPGAHLCEAACSYKLSAGRATWAAT
jgi:hypothetical protein